MQVFNLKLGENVLMQCGILSGYNVEEIQPDFDLFIYLFNSTN